VKFTERWFQRMFCRHSIHQRRGNFMHRFIYIGALLMCFNFAIAAGDNSPQSNDLDDSLANCFNANYAHRINHKESEALFSPNSLSLMSESSSVPEINSLGSPLNDEKSLADLLAWGAKRSDVADDLVEADQNNNDITCDEADPFMICARALKPFMKKQRWYYTDQEKDDFNNTFTKTFEKFASLTPMERYHIVQKLNILALFEGEITCVNSKGKGRNKVQNVIKFSLADKFRIKKNRRNPMTMLCCQIDSGAITSENATLDIFNEWKDVDVLEQRVKSCARRLKQNGFFKYQRVEDVLVELLQHCTDHLSHVEFLTYSKNKIKKTCKKIRKKNKNRNEYTQNAARLIEAKWRNEGMLDTAIADCSDQLTKFRAYAGYALVDTKDD
jgi:hypothetical protein